MISEQMFYLIIIAIIILIQIGIEIHVETAVFNFHFYLSYCCQNFILFLLFNIFF